MIDDPEILSEFVVESSEHLADVENELLALECPNGDVDEELVNKVFRAVHSVKGAAGFLGLVNIGQLAHALEHVLNLVRDRQLAPQGKVIDGLLSGTDCLSRLLADVETSEDIDVQVYLDELSTLATEPERRPAAESTDGDTPPTATDQGADYQKVKLRGGLDVSTVNEIHLTILESIGCGTSVRVDCGEVEYIDASVLQVLLSADRELDAFGGDLRLINVRRPLAEILGYSGATHIIEPAGR